MANLVWKKVNKRICNVRGISDYFILFWFLSAIVVETVSLDLFRKIIFIIHFRLFLMSVILSETSKIVLLTPFNKVDSRFNVC